MTNGARLSTVIAFCLAMVAVDPTAHAAQKTFTGNVSSDWFNGDNWNPAGAPAPGDDVVLGSGTLDLSGGSATVATYTHNNGTLTGSGTLTVTGLMTWERGVIRGSGILNANGGIAMAALSSLTITDTRTLNNAAIATWTGPGNFSLGGNTVFNNLNGATFEIRTAADMGSGTFNNMGTVTKELGSGDGVTGISSLLVDSGTMTVISGTLSLSGAGTHDGTVNVQAGASFNFAGGTHTVGGSMSSTDMIGFNAGTITFESGSTYDVGEQTVISGSTVTFEGGATVDLSDTLVIEGGSLNLSSGTNFTVATYEHANGTLTGSDNLTVTGPMTWERGVIRGTGVLNANGGIAMAALATITLTDTRTLNNAGTATWNGPGAFSLGGNAILNNLESGTFRIQTAADMGSGTFNNMGTMTKELGSGDGVTSLSSFLSNSGTITIISGALSLSGSGMHDGPLAVQPAAGFNFAGGTHTVTDAITSADTIGFSSGTITFESGSTYSVGEVTLISGSNVTFEAGADVSLSDTLMIEGGSLNLSSGTDFIVATYVHSNGTLTGSDDLTVTGPMTWARGILRGTGVVNANGGLALTALTTVTLTDTRTLNNADEATWDGPGNFSLGGNAIFNNLEGATFEIQTAADMGSGTFNNMGAVSKLAGSGDGVTGISSFVSNMGAIVVTSGTLNVTGGGVHSGTLNVETGGAFAFMGGTHTVTGSVISPDTIGFNGGSITFESGATYAVGEETVIDSSSVIFEPGSNVALSDTLEINGASLDLSSGTDPGVATYTHANGTLTGSDDLTVTGAMTWERGVIRGTGTLNANGSVAMTALAAVTLTDTRTFNNGGVATWSGPGDFSLGGNAIFNNLPGSQFRIQTPADMGSGTLNNMGTMTKEVGGGDGVTGVSSAIFNSGIIEIPSGSLSLTGSYTQTAGALRLNGGSLQSNRLLQINGGALEGAGIVTANVAIEQNGIASPGLSAGSLRITGNYTQDDDGAYAVEIGGPVAGSGFDLLEITGPAALGGAIGADLIDGFEPTVGQAFQVMTFASRAGDFDEESGLVVGGGFGFRKVLGEADVTLQYVQEICDDTQDNDADGRVDCMDPKCADVSFCLMSPTPTATPTVTPTNTATSTSSPTSTATAVPTPSSTETAPPTPTATEGDAPTATPTPSVTATPTIDCVGDCQGDRVVTVDEIIIGVSIALGTVSVDQCPVFDFNGDRAVTVEEIITAVRQALEGCPDLTPMPVLGASRT